MCLIKVAAEPPPPRSGGKSGLIKVASERSIPPCISLEKMRSKRSSSALAIVQSRTNVVRNNIIRFIVYLPGKIKSGIQGNIVFPNFIRIFPTTIFQGYMGIGP